MLTLLLTACPDFRYGSKAAISCSCPIPVLMPDDVRAWEHLAVKNTPPPADYPKYLDDLAYQQGMLLNCRN